MKKNAVLVSILLIFTLISLPTFARMRIVYADRMPAPGEYTAPISTVIYGGIPNQAIGPNITVFAKYAVNFDQTDLPFGIGLTGSMGKILTIVVGADGAVTSVKLAPPTGDTNKTIQTSGTLSTQNQTKN